ncbi:hypothetical protein BB560_003975 [Smittium megazygosporum]|uniref:BAR domain-containing protein n=1 Tax=Smittium megazygosporum TaxID=133381 RepID=A0A2T9ZAJ7_9FUNG|nr:hypothetical protein BB560_003975 [Smittium megazygosporum]
MDDSPKSATPKEVTDSSPSPRATNYNSGFNQFKRLAFEKIGVVSDITPLPEDYVELEKQVTKIKNTLVTLLRLWKLIINDDRMTGFQPIQNHISDAKSNFTDIFWKRRSTRNSSISEISIKSDSGGNFSIDSFPQEISDNDMTPSIFNKFGDTCTDNSVGIGLDQPLGSILFKFGCIEENIGVFKNTMDKTVFNDSLPSFEDLLSKELVSINESSTQVHKARLALDTVKSMVQPQTESGSDVKSAELEEAQAKFYSALNESIKKMTLFTKSSGLLDILLFFIKEQLRFYKETSLLISDLLPEIEEAKVKHDKLYFPDPSNKSLSTKQETESPTITFSSNTDVKERRDSKIPIESISELPKNTTFHKTDDAGKNSTSFESIRSFEQKNDSATKLDIIDGTKPSKNKKKYKLVKKKSQNLENNNPVPEPDNTSIDNENRNIEKGDNKETKTVNGIEKQGSKDLDIKEDELEIPESEKNTQDSKSEKKNTISKDAKPNTNLATKKKKGMPNGTQYGPGAYEGDAKKANDTESLGSSDYEDSNTVINNLDVYQVD